MFLAFFEECPQHHCVSLVDRGHNGIQLRVEYASPDNATEHFGTISLTFYANTSCLLVQGTSYLLWINEHLPIIYKKAEQTYEENMGKWLDIVASAWITHQAREEVGGDGDGGGGGSLTLTDPKVGHTSLPTSPHSLNTRPSTSDNKVSLSIAACPHIVCDPQTAASPSHEAHNNPISGGDRCSVPPLSSTLPILDTLYQDDLFPGGPSQDDLSQVISSHGDLPQDDTSQGTLPQDDPSQELVAIRLFHTPTRTASSGCLMLHRTVHALWILYGNPYRNRAGKEGETVT